jgi:hypothetical protein
MRRARTALAAALVAATATAAAAQLAASARLDPRIPRADHARYEREWKMRWRNPRVVVDRDGVFLLLGDRGFGEGEAPVADLAAALVALPRKAWPYGRVVALTETPRTPAADRLDAVRATLRSLGVEAVETPVGCECLTPDGKTHR